MNIRKSNLGNRPNYKVSEENKIRFSAVAQNTRQYKVDAGGSRSYLPPDNYKSAIVGRGSGVSGFKNSSENANFGNGRTALHLDRSSKIVRRNLAKGRNIEKDENKYNQMIGKELIWEQAVTSDDYLNHTIGPNRTFRVD